MIKIFTSNLQDILRQPVSFQMNAWSPLSKELSITEVLEEIKGEKHKAQVLLLRTLLENENKDGYDTHKKNLPAVTFCGTFDNARKKDALKTYNSVIVLDIDKLQKDEFIRAKECLIAEPLVFSLWESPSRAGLKGLVFVEYQMEVNHSNVDNIHKCAFQKLSIYFKEKHNLELDKTGSDTTRLCFFSYDPMLCLKKEVIPFLIVDSDISEISEKKEKGALSKVKHNSDKDALYNPENKNLPNDRCAMQAILKFLEKRSFSITNSYEEWYKVAMSIANTFTFDVGLKYFLRLSKLDQNKFNQVNCENFLASCYQSRNGEIKFNTIIYFANQKGYLTKKQRERGSEAADESLSYVSSS